VVASIFGDYGIIDDVVMFLRWPFLFLMGAAGIAVLYRLGPDRRSAKWRWLTPGAFVACALWVAGSYGFSLYVQSFGSYNETFGALGGVIILLTWLWLSAFIVLLGALLDAELEAQTKRDSTVGEDRPIGQRGAVKADTVGAALGEKMTEPSQ
jgi:membrane protein